MTSQHAETTARRGMTRLSVVETGLQAFTILMLIATLVAVQAHAPIAVLSLPIMSIAIWVCSGLLIDRQALRPVRA